MQLGLANAIANEGAMRQELAVAMFPNRVEVPRALLPSFPKESFAVGVLSVLAKGRRRLPRSHVFWFQGTLFYLQGTLLVMGLEVPLSTSICSYRYTS